MMRMKNWNATLKAARLEKAGQVDLSRVFENLELWATAAMRIEFIVAGDAGPIINVGKIIATSLPVEAVEGKATKRFEFLADSGMRVILDPQSWRRVRVDSEAPLSSISVATGLPSLRAGFVLQPSIAGDKDWEQVATADQQLRKWQAEETPCLVSLRVGSFELHFGAKVVISEEEEFGYKEVQGSFFCTASPQECDHSEVIEADGYTCVRMKDNRTGNTVMITDSRQRPEDLFSRFPLGSKLKQ